MSRDVTRPPDLAAVIVHGPATSPLTGLLWDLGLRPLAATTGPTVWVPARTDPAHHGQPR